MTRSGHGDSDKVKGVGDNANRWIYDGGMVGWFTRRRRMVGGLYFGQPGWGVERIEGMEETVKGEGARVVPAGRAEFAMLLEEIGLLRTSAVTPGLLEQMAEIGERDIRAIVLNLLPTQPEFAMGPGLSKVAMAEMMAGLLAIQGVVKARRVMVVGDRHDWRTRRLWRRAVKAETAKRRLGEGAKEERRRNAAVELKGLLNQYPQAHPTLLLRRLFGEAVAGGTPAGAGESGDCGSGDVLGGSGGGCSPARN